MSSISFTLLSYNHERFIREAIQSCLGLVGGPYDIVISDDASTDKTPEIIRECVSQYTGPHEVTVEIQPTNLGVQGNLRRAARLCKGDYIVVCGGDDVVLPDRARAVAEIVDRFPSTAAVVCSAFVIDEQGQTQATLDVRPGELSPLQIVASGGGVAVGPCYAYRRDCLEEYFQSSAELAAEDRVIPLLCALRGGVVATDRRLLKYRKHFSSLTYTGSRRYLHPFENPAHVRFMRDQCAGFGRLTPLMRAVLALKTRRHSASSIAVRGIADYLDRVVGRLANLNVQKTQSVIFT